MTATATRSPSVRTTPRPAARDLLQSRGPAAFVAAVSALISFRILSEGGFFQDDFRVIGQARAGLSLHLLFTPIGTTHLQPVNRFLEWLIADPLHESFTGSVVVLCLISGLGTYWVVRLLDTIGGPRRTHLIIGLLFGTSPVLIGGSQWVGAAAASALAVDFAAGACLGFFHWLSTGRRRSYALSVLAVALAVGSWETALAAPAIITLMWLCFARRWQPVRRALLAQLSLYAVSLAFVIYVEFQPWHQPLQIPGIVSWLGLLGVMVGRALSASVVGVGAPSGPQTTFELVCEIAVLVVLAAGVVWLALRRRFRWSVLFLFAAGTVLVSVPVATTRDFLGAAIAGTTMRYVTFLPLLFAISLGGSVRPQSGGDVPPALRAGPDGRIGRPDSRLQQATRRRLPKAAWVAVPVVLALALAGYLVNLSHTFNSSQYAIVMGRAGLGEAQRMGAGITVLGRSGERSLVDSTVPDVIYYATVHDGSNELSYLLPYWSRTARAFGEGRITGVDPVGLVRWAVFRPHGSGPQYARVVVRTSAPTTVVVRITAVNPTEPEVPWRIQTGPGIHSFTLASWATAVRNVSVTGRGLTVVRVQTGTVTLTTLVE